MVAPGRRVIRVRRAHRGRCGWCRSVWHLISRRSTFAVTLGSGRKKIKTPVNSVFYRLHAERWSDLFIRRLGSVGTPVNGVAARQRSFARQRGRSRAVNGVKPVDGGGGPSSLPNGVEPVDGGGGPSTGLSPLTGSWGASTGLSPLTGAEGRQRVKPVLDGVGGGVNGIEPVNGGGGPSTG